MLGQVMMKMKMVAGKRTWSTLDDHGGGDNRIRSRSLLRLGFAVCMALVLVASPSSGRTSGRLAPDEVSALQQIAKTLGKTDWNFQVDPCSGESGWATPKLQEGFENAVTCTCPENVTDYCHIHSIVLKRQGLQGTLPKELTRLPFLRQFDVSCNYLNGTIPKEWGALQVVHVSLSGNRLSGSIPKELGDIITLENLSLEGNNFSGEIPPHIGSLTNLRELVLSSNKFTGELPHALERLSNITDFRISDNLLSGNFPDFIVKWTQLQRLHIEGTLLAGPIPSGISELEHLSQLRISDMVGTNTEFPNLIRMKNLTQLIIRNCMLSGQIPYYIGQLTSLRLLDLSFNNLTCGLPDSLRDLKRLQFMYFTNNSLTGLLPDWILGTSMEVDLSYNNFTGMASDASVSCTQGRTNLVKTFSTASGNQNVIHPCLKQTCDVRKPKHSSFHINCGDSKSAIIGNRKFDGDDGINGGATFFISSQGSWALSSTGTIVDNNDDTDVYTVSNSSILSMPNPELYMVARISPLSLKYYGLCLWNGPYTVTLYFAEIEITDDKNCSSLGNRIFDVYIQGKKELHDFNIKNFANGSGKATVQIFHVNVTANLLEIHFFWAGKGTTRIPRAGVYGPLISAISVESDFQPPGEGHNKKIIILTVIAVASLLLMFLIIGVIWKRHLFCWRPAEMELQRLNLQTGFFTLRQIKGATNNFHARNRIGEGGFGPVYKGYLPDGTIVAVKKLSSKSKQGSREFITEIGMISALQHPNLVRLYGCCSEGKQLLLVYEYMENNSLAQALFGPEENRLKLDWSTRRKICIGIARGLAYLHEESALKIVHRDIKCTNVLLDKDLNAKISDFGLAKLNENENTHISTHIAGTFGYMAPEYAMRGHLSFKSDVYSFGVVALEIASGKSNARYKHSEEDVYLLDWAHLLQDKGTLLEMVDQDLGSSYSKEQALTMINVALLCTNPSPSFRPTMSTVVSMLEGQTPVQPPLPSHELSSTELHKKTRGILTPESSIQSQAYSKVPWSVSSISDPEVEEESGCVLAERSHEICNCNKESATTHPGNDESPA